MDDPNKKTLTTKLSCNLQAREAYWSKAFAVGSEEWLSGIAGKDQKHVNIYQNSEFDPFYLNFRKIE